MAAALTKSRLSGTETKVFRLLPCLDSSNRTHAHMRVASYWLALAVFFALATFPARAQTNVELNSAAEIRALTPEQAQQRIPVHLNAVVTFFTKDFFSCFVQDATAGIYLTFPLAAWPDNLDPGKRSRLWARPAPANMRRS